MIRRFSTTQVRIDVMAWEAECEMNECKLVKMEQLMVIKVKQSSAILLIN